MGWDWDGWDGMDLRVGGGIEHLTVLIMNTNKHIDGQLFCALECFDWDKTVLEFVQK